MFSSLLWVTLSVGPYVVMFTQLVKVIQNETNYGPILMIRVIHFTAIDVSAIQVIGYYVTSSHLKTIPLSCDKSTTIRLLSILD